MMGICSLMTAEASCTASTSARFERIASACCFRLSHAELPPGMPRDDERRSSARRFKSVSSLANSRGVPASALPACSGIACDNAANSGRVVSDPLPSIDCRYRNPAAATRSNAIVVARIANAGDLSVFWAMVLQHSVNFVERLHSAAACKNVLLSIRSYSPKIGQVS